MLVFHSSRLRLRPASRQAASTQWSGSRSQICTPLVLGVAESRAVGRQGDEFERVVGDRDWGAELYAGGDVVEFWGSRVTVFLEVTGAAHHLPAYAGNLDIMTSAALAAAERLVP